MGSIIRLLPLQRELDALELLISLCTVSSTSVRFATALFYDFIHLFTTCHLSVWASIYLTVNQCVCVSVLGHVSPIASMLPKRTALTQTGVSAIRSEPTRDTRVCNQL